MTRQDREIYELNEETKNYFDDSIERLESIEELLISIEDILLGILDCLEEKKSDKKKQNKKATIRRVR